MNSKASQKIQLKEHLTQQINGSSISLFRIFFGLVLTLHVLDQWRLIAEKYIEPTFHFSYPFLDFIQPLPGNGMYVVFGIMLLSSLCIMFGIAYRLFSVLFFIAYTYVFFIDTSNYKNHYYLIVLTSFLMMFVPADNDYALKIKKIFKPAYRWQLYLLRFQIAIVYFHAGIAKLNYDWFYGFPVKLLLPARFSVGHYPILGQLVRQDWFTLGFSYAGLIFDLLIGFLLINRRTLHLATFLVLAFNLLNYWIFQTISAFSQLMIVSLILFYAPDWPEELKKKMGAPASRRPSALQESGTLETGNLGIPAVKDRHYKSSFTFALLILYCLVQIVLPYRHFLYKGDVFWTAQGERFSWRMMLKVEEAKLNFTVWDEFKGKSWKLNLNDFFLTKRQYWAMLNRPELILQFVHHVNRQLNKKGIVHTKITADARQSINRRPYQRFIASDVNLIKISPYDSYDQWVLPFDHKFER